MLMSTARNSAQVPPIEPATENEEEQGKEEEADKECESDEHPILFHIEYDVNLNNDGDSIRSRVKEDIFHRFQDSPFEKNFRYKHLL